MRCPYFSSEQIHVGFTYINDQERESLTAFPAKGFLAHLSHDKELKGNVSK